MTSSLTEVLLSRETLTQNGTLDQAGKHEIATLASLSLDPSLREWTIKGMVTRKREPTRFRYARGEGVVFSFDLTDDEGTEIRCTCYNATASRLHDRIRVGRAYFISNGTLKPLQPPNLNLRENPAALVHRESRSEWEITLGSSSFVEPCASDSESDDLRSDFALIAGMLFPKCAKSVGEVPSAAMPIEEPTSPQTTERRRIPVKGEKSLGESEEHNALQKSLISEPSSEPHGSTAPPRMESQDREQRSGDPKSELLQESIDPTNPAGLEKPKYFDMPERAPIQSIQKPEVREIGCGDNDVRVDTDVREWVGGEGYPANPLSYHYACPTGWD